MMPGVNYLIYGCSSARATPEVSLYRSLNTAEKYHCSYSSRQGVDRVIDEILKGKLKTELCVLVNCSYWPKFFNTLSTGQSILAFTHSLCSITT